MKFPHFCIQLFRIKCYFRGGIEDRLFSFYWIYFMLDSGRKIVSNEEREKVKERKRVSRLSTFSSARSKAPGFAENTLSF